MEVFDRKYLVEYPSRVIWLSEAEAWLPFNGLNSILMAPCLNAMRVLEFFLEEIDRSWNIRLSG
jgi:hypothetical protein